MRTVLVGEAVEKEGERRTWREKEYGRGALWVNSADSLLAY
jgi:hypothetical protein